MLHNEIQPEPNAVAVQEPLRALKVSVSREPRHISALLLLGFIVICVRKAKPNPAIFAAGFGMAVLLFFVLGKQAFVNYYFLVCWSFMLAALIVYQTSPSGDLANVAQAAKTV